MIKSFVKMHPMGVCNVCGRVLDECESRDDYSITRVIGYGSKYDGLSLDLRLCCDCLDKLIDSCKVMPIEG